MPIAELEAFSDTDSDEEDSDYEEVVIPKVKRKRDIEEENSNVKRTKLIPKSKFPSKRRPRVSKGASAPPPGKPPKRFKPSKSKLSSIPSRR